MAKRKKTDIVQLKLRIREHLRRRLETTAAAEERSLNSEIAARLEESFVQTQNSDLLKALLSPGLGLDLLRSIAVILNVAGVKWNEPPQSHAVTDAINKVVAVFTKELSPAPVSFPNAEDKSSGDHLAWLALLVLRMNWKDEIALKGWKQ